MGKVVSGSLHLEQPVPLPDDTKVRIRIEPVADWQVRQREGLKALQRLIREQPIHSGGTRFTREELHERD